MTLGYSKFFTNNTFMGCPVRSLELLIQSEEVIIGRSYGDTLNQLPCCYNAQNKVVTADVMSLRAKLMLYVRLANV